VRAEKGRERRDEVLRTSEAQIRLQKLEEMVTTLMQRSGEGSEGLNAKTSSSSKTVEQSISNLSVDGSPYPSNGASGGHWDVKGSEVNYLGATHWSTILENVGSFPQNFPTL
jgi:hypothetical protein